MICIMNQLEEHQAGFTEINSHAISADNLTINLLWHVVGIMFQHFNLFPHLTILDN